MAAWYFDQIISFKIPCRAADQICVMVSNAEEISGSSEVHVAYEDSVSEDGTFHSVNEPLLRDRPRKMSKSSIRGWRRIEEVHLNKCDSAQLREGHSMTSGYRPRGMERPSSLQNDDCMGKKPGDA